MQDFLPDLKRILPNEKTDGVIFDTEWKINVLKKIFHHSDQDLLLFKEWVKKLQLKKQQAQYIPLYCIYDSYNLEKLNDIVDYIMEDKLEPMETFWERRERVFEYFDRRPNFLSSETLI